MSQNTKAKETYYDGYRFRSRLEARWAVFFNNIGLEYEYEDSIGRPSTGFGRIQQVCRGISSPAGALRSTVSAPVFLFVGHGVGQNTILVF